MKTIKLAVSLITFITINIYGQENKSTQNSNNSIEGHNTWSIDLNGGLTSFNGFTGIGDNYAEFSNDGLDILPTKSKGFRFSPLHINIGVRKMISPKFGFKLGINYTNLKNTDQLSNNFESTYIGGDLQGVVNLNQILDFKLLGNRLNFLAHAGLGFASFTLNDKYTIDNYSSGKSDYVMSGVFGFTSQIRIIDRLALTFDASNTFYGKHQLQLDGTRMKSDGGLVDASVMNLTAGFTYYLGKNQKNTDWENFKNDTSNENNKEVDALKQRIADLEKNNNSKGIDMSAIQKMINEKAGKDTQKQQDIAKELINNGYIATYFEYNVANPTNESTESIDFILNYLRLNPNSKITVTGYTDEKGNAEFNNKLALKRAENIKTTLQKAGVNASRITIASGGQDKTVDIDSEWARNTVRKVLFKVQ